MLSSVDARVLAVAVCAVMAGAPSFAAIGGWLHDLDERARTRLGSGNAVPAGTTVWRLLIRLDPSLLGTVSRRLAAHPGPPPRRYRQVIAVDGKTLGLRHEVARFEWIASRRIVM